MKTGTTGIFQIVVLSGLIAGALCMTKAGEPRLEFTRMVAHWSQYGDPAYLDFIDDAEPELVQLGFYGGHFWSLAHTPQYKGYPAHFPVQGIPECGKWFREKNRHLRKKKIKVIGHFNVEFLVGEPDGEEGPRGFFKFYRELWDEKLLGPKPPVEDPLDFMERTRDGDPRMTTSYHIGKMPEYFACLRNPHWQTVLKAWVTHGINQGLDGFIANYFYRHDCHCQHCQADFRKYLAEHHDTKSLASLGIKNLDTHQFDEIVCWHKPDESTPLRREMLRWSQISNKEVFDEVFIKHGRSLKSDLIVAQWNHLSNFSQINGDERCLLPADQWGVGEDYLWYSMGGSGVHTDIKNGVLADGILQARYIRGAFDDKPFTLGKYESVRTRVAIAELAANGGSPMGFYAKFTNPDVREVFKTYYGFLKRYQDLYHANRSYADVVLVFPRKEIHQGNLAPLEGFKSRGKKLLNSHQLFDVVPNDLPDYEIRAANYSKVIAPLDSHPLEKLSSAQINAPNTVRVSASIPAHQGEIDLHFVNYNRKEFPPHPKTGRPVPGKGPADENPISVSGITVSISPPEGQVIASIEFITPEHPDPVELDRDPGDNDRVNFTVPEFLVYGVVRMKIQSKVHDQSPKVAGVTTVYHHNSHSDVIMSRITETDSLDWEGRKPDLNLTAVYIDQFSERDTGRKHAEKYSWQLKDKVADALTNGSDQLQVDGVLLVAEHGEYEKSDTTQTMYPKRRLFGEIIDTFEKTGKVVPVFCDKHLADNWKDAKWIYDQSKRLDFPMMAGSSVPGTWRYPPTDVKRDAKLKEIVGISYHTLDHYGFHGMEVLQSLAERRAGGETGIKRVQCIAGDEVWTSSLYNRELFQAALDRQERQQHLKRKPLPELVKAPVLFVIEYKDGLRASMLTLNGAAVNWTAAWRYEDDTIDSTLFWTQEARPYFHFAHFTRAIEKMIHSGKPTWPVERTLMTSGALNACLISKRDGGGWLETPELGFGYQSNWDWKQPPPPPRGRRHDEQ